MKIKAILCCMNSKTDLNGNRYWAFRYVDTATGLQACGLVDGGESNVSALVRELGLSWEEVYYYREEIPKREFQRQTKDFAYAGCRQESLAAFVNERLR
jgi:hypothetical protein